MSSSRDPQKDFGRSKQNSTSLFETRGVVTLYSLYGRKIVAVSLLKKGKCTETYSLPDYYRIVIVIDYKRLEIRGPC